MAVFHGIRSSQFVACVLGGLLALSGCGGGAGGATSGSGGSTGNDPGTPAPDPGNLLTTLPSATYATGSREAQIFSEINAVRGTQFGYMVQSTNLDKAAASHALYLQTNDVVPMIDPSGIQVVINGILMSQMGVQYYAVDPSTGIIGGHSEDVGKPGFTGATPADRESAAGFIGSGSEVVAQENVPLFPTSMPCVANLVNTVYHQAALLTPTYSSVGIGVSNLPNVYDRTCVIDFGTPKPIQVTLPDGWVGVYPTDKATGTPRAMWNREDPDPAPEYATIGSPVSVYSKDTLTVTAFTLTGPTGPVPAKVMTKATSGAYLTGTQAFLVPNGALALNTTYTASFQGSQGGVAINKTWSFTTVASDGH